MQTNNSEENRLSPAAEQILEAVDRELPAIIPRHKINKLSPSCPLDHRTWANKDSLARKLTGQPLVEQTEMAGRIFYLKPSFMQALKNELSKVK